MTNYEFTSTVDMKVYEISMDLDSNMSRVLSDKVPNSVSNVMSLVSSIKDAQYGMQRAETELEYLKQTRAQKYSEAFLDTEVGVGRLSEKAMTLYAEAKCHDTDLMIRIYEVVIKTVRDKIENVKLLLTELNSCGIIEEKKTKTATKTAAKSKTETETVTKAKTTKKQILNE